MLSNAILYFNNKTHYYVTCFCHDGTFIHWHKCVLYFNESTVLYKTTFHIKVKLLSELPTGIQILIFFKISWCCLFFFSFFARAIFYIDIILFVFQLDKKKIKSFPCLCYCYIFFCFLIYSLWPWILWVQLQQEL